jgi:hypothetical protein
MLVELQAATVGAKSKAASPTLLIPPATFGASRCRGVGQCKLAGRRNHLCAFRIKIPQLYAGTRQTRCQAGIERLGPCACRSLNGIALGCTSGCSHCTQNRLEARRDGDVRAR